MSSKISNSHNSVLWLMLFGALSSVLQLLSSDCWPSYKNSWKKKGVKFEQLHNCYITRRGAVLITIKKTNHRLAYSIGYQRRVLKALNKFQLYFGGEERCNCIYKIASLSAGALAQSVSQQLQWSWERRRETTVLSLSLPLLRLLPPLTLRPFVQF